MDLNEVKTLILTAVPGAEVLVEDLVGDGDHLQATVIAEQFEGMTLIKQHQLINNAIPHLKDGRLHALALKTYTPTQWRNTQIQVGGS